MKIYGCRTSMHPGRREFIASVCALGGAAATSGGCTCMRGEESPLVRFGMVADIHYADRDSFGPCHFRESLGRLDEAVAVFNRRSLDFAIELGDFKDMSADRQSTVACLDAVEASFSKFRGPRHHVPGNHDFDCLEPSEFFSRISNGGQPASGRYFFDVNGVRFIVLDGCHDSSFRHYSCANPWDDSNIPPEQLQWLSRVLRDGTGPVVVFCHQRLDPGAEPRHLVRNAETVRAVLERSGRVRTVITGHQHSGGYAVCRGIVYYTLAALVDCGDEGSSSFAEADVFADGTVAVKGWQRAASCARLREDVKF